MQKVKLNLIPQGVPPVVYASQYDVGRQFEFEIYEGDVEYEIPSDTVITIHGIKKDNHSFAYSTNDDTSKQIEFSSSLISIVTTEQMTLVPGDIHCEFVLRKNLNSEDILGTLNFIIHVEPCPIPEDAATSASDLQAYQDMVDRTHASEVAAKNSEVASAENLQKSKDALNVVNNEIFRYGMKQEDMILEASKWNGDNPPFTYDLTNELGTDAAIIALKYTANPDQVDQWKMSGVRASDDNVLKATLSKPRVNLPVIVIHQEVKDSGVIV